MIAQNVLVFVMNIKLATVVPIAYPEIINYCVGYDIHDQYMLSCLTMEGKIFDMWYSEREA